MIEVEIRAKIENKDLVKESLNSITAQFIKTIRQEDRIFGHPKFLDENTKIIEGGLSARIRRVDNNSKLEFKEAQITNEKYGDMMQNIINKNL